MRIVDISSLRPVARRTETGDIYVTPRRELQRYIDQIALAGPAAIGIDVIFDPEPDGSAGRIEDDEFLEHCRNLRDEAGHPVPVRVGIYRSIALGKDRWLGKKEFGDLGASVIVPSDRGGAAPIGSMIKWFSLAGAPGEIYARSLSYSLFEIAQNTAEQSRTHHRLLGKQLQATFPNLVLGSESRVHGDVRANLILIDFGVLEKLKRTQIQAEDIPQRSSELKGKIVLIGRTEPDNPSDVFSTSESDRLISGIYTHAAALDTMMEAPLFELSESGRNLLDSITTGFLLCCAIVLYAIFNAERHEKVRGKIETAIPMLLACLTTMIGWVCVDVTGIYWVDFLVFGFMLVIATQVGAVLEVIFALLVSVGRRAARVRHPVLGLLLLGLGVRAIAAQDLPPIGIIQSLSGDVKLYPKVPANDRKGIPSDPSRLLLHPLWAGDRLQVLGNGEAKVLLCTGRLRILRAADGVVELAPVKGTNDQTLCQSLLQFGRPGASREIAPLVWMPSNSTEIRAEDFRLRWNPPHTVEDFAVSILRPDGTVLWSAAAVNSAEGGLSQAQESEIARLLLRERGESEKKTYSVSVASDMQGSQESRFVVISSGDELKIQAVLARWNIAGLDPLVRSICRAEAWRNANLFYKAAEEYEQALSLAPNSEALLAADLALHKRIGDVERSRQLAERLR